MRACLLLASVLLMTAMFTAYAITDVEEIGAALDGDDISLDASDEEHDAYEGEDMEASDLGEDDELEDYDETGKGKGGGMLSTTGSFTLSGGSSNAGNELGEGDETGKGKGGGMLSTTGSFTLSGGSSNAGNEEDEDY
eukprot:TRINITY_DN124_c0_g1_i1.p1 TRINITY_DN124_c0_g1~~TRINITY_DN124_c0_g1_i1.p1  ORF type:complete len:138 (+),score=30.67 TRINITY_DN124_c0_g1_i1:211-624(+)